MAASAPSRPDPAAAQERSEGFPNGHLLWSPAQLKARLGDPKLALVDLRPSHELLRGVIPGAAHFDLYGIGLTSTHGPLLDEFLNLMRSLLGLRGVGHEKTVVFYEKDTGIRAARAFWLLEYFGHADVHVLDGGMQAWLGASYPLAQEMAEPHPASFKIDAQKQLVIGADELWRKIEAGEVVPLDTRTDEEYFGTSKRAARAGAIPKAVHLEWTHYLDAHGRFKPPSELDALFKSAGITKDKAIAPY
jgi:thiosulfate/3-mercaptopyruvate sulfurtransferase